MTYEGLIFRWCEVANVPQSVLAGDIVPQVLDDASWRRWAALETTKRTILGHCVTDGTISALFGVSPAARYTLHPILLASDDQSFLASTLDSWRAILPRSQSTTLPSFVGALLSAGQLPPISPSSLNLQTVLECLNAFISDWDKSNGGAIGLTPTTVPGEGALPTLSYDQNLPRHTRPLARRLNLRSRDLLAARQHHTSPAVALRSPSSAHAVALRVMAEQLPIATSTFPDFTLPVSFFRGALALTKYHQVLDWVTSPRS